MQFNFLSKNISFVYCLSLFSLSFFGFYNSYGQTGCVGTAVNITFGSGIGNPGPKMSSAVLGASTTYNFASYSTGYPPASIFDGDYALVNQVPNNGGWFLGAKDHTGDPNGYMAFFNSSPSPGYFYSQTVTGLTPNTTYEFSAWIANVLKPSAYPNGVLPNITFEIIDTTSSNIILASYNTGDIAMSSSMNWKKYGMYFKMPASTNTILLRLSNNNIGGTLLPGNDLALDDIIFSPCLSSLPISIKSFHGEIANHSAILKWTTANEVNIVSSVIERSYDGTHFTSMGIVRLKDLANNNSYSYTDNPSFINRNVFYRIKLIDKDGTFTYSNILSFSLTNKINNDISIYPNPAKNFFILTCNASKEESSKVAIVDVTSKVVFEYPIKLCSGANCFNINISNKLKRGIYFIQYSIDGKMTTKKLMIE